MSDISNKNLAAAITQVASQLANVTECLLANIKRLSEENDDLRSLILNIQTRNVCEVATLEYGIKDIKSDLQDIRNTITDLDETLFICLDDRD